MRKYEWLSQSFARTLSAKARCGCGAVGFFDRQRLPPDTIMKDNSRTVDFLHSLPFHDFNVDHWLRSVILASVSYSIFWFFLFCVTLIAISQFQRSCLCGRREIPKPSPPLGWKPAMVMVRKLGGGALPAA